MKREKAYVDARRKSILELLRENPTVRVDELAKADGSFFDYDPQRSAVSGRAEAVGQILRRRPGGRPGDCGEK